MNIDLSDLDSLNLSPRARRVALRARLRNWAAKEGRTDLLARLEREHLTASLSEWDDDSLDRVAELFTK
jgi:ribosome assembly protein YihI (activator of Der GTPase)